MGTARLPVGVRLEFVGDAERSSSTTRRAPTSSGIAGPGAGTAFALFRGGKQVDEQPAVLGDGTVRLALGGGDPDERGVVYLPEGMRPVVHAVAAVSGTIEPARARAAVARIRGLDRRRMDRDRAGGRVAGDRGRDRGLDVVNLGYAGSARGELVSAEQIAALDADVISISHGTNCWTRIPFSAALFRENTPSVPGGRAAGAPGDPDRGDEPGAAPRRRSDAEPPRRDARRPPRRHGGPRRASASPRATIGSRWWRAAVCSSPTTYPTASTPATTGHRTLATAFGGAVREALEAT